MKKLKRILAVALALMMALALAVPAMAAEAVDPMAPANVSIQTGPVATFANEVAPTSYNGYKLFTMTSQLTCTKTEDTDPGHTHTLEDGCYLLAYEVRTDTKADAINTALVASYNKIYDPDVSGAANVLKGLEGKSGNDLQKFANEVYKALVTASVAADVTFDANSTASVEQGYWLFADASALTGDGKAHNVVVLATNGQPDIVITPKSVVPTLTKAADKATASIGEDVTFTLTGTLPSATDLISYETYQYIFTDTLPAGLTYNNDAVITLVKANNTETVITGNFTPNQTDNKITWTCSDLLTLTVDGAPVAVAEDDQIVVTYSAELNGNAVIGGNGNVNTAFLTYSNDPYTAGTGNTPNATATVYSYSFDLVKTDDAGVVIYGAQFELYDAETNGNKINLVAKGDGYRVATPAEAGAAGFTSAVISAGSVTIEGLANGTYHLEETVAPDGYNMLTERTAVVISGGNLDAVVDAGNYTRGGVQVVNHSGTLLPGTGGMGTTVLYVMGGVLMAGAVILLIARKRREQQ